MAGTAHRNAADPGGPAPGRPDLDVRRALVVATRTVVLAVEELARDPGSGPALEMARLVLSVQEALGEQARADEAVIEAERARAVAQDRAGRRALRPRRLRVAR